MSQNQSIAKEEASQSSDVLLTSILAHEQEVRGIDWMTDLFDESGQEKPGFLAAKVQEAAADLPQDFAPAPQAAKGPLLRKKLGQAPMLGASKDAGDNIGNIVRFKEDAYKVLYDAIDDDIKDKLLATVKQLQQLENQLKSGDFDSSIISKVGAIGSGVMATAGVLFTAGTYGTAVAAAVMLPVAMGATAATGAIVFIAALAAAVAVLIVAIVGVVVLMLKQASELHLVLNNTDYELRVYEIYCRHGKVLTQPSTDTFQRVIPARAMMELEEYDGTKKMQRIIYGGYFGMSKKDGAMFGADGVIQLDMYDKNGHKHQTSTFLAYEVPLVGKNSCYARCSVGNPSASEFFNNHEDDIEYGHFEWTDHSGNIALRKRINSRKGEDCYAITTYEQV